MQVTWYMHKCWYCRENSIAFAIWIILKIIYQKYMQLFTKISHDYMYKYDLWPITKFYWLFITVQCSSWRSYLIVWFVVLTVMTVMINVFWDVMLCSQVAAFQSSQATCCLHLHSSLCFSWFIRAPILLVPLPITIPLCIHALSYSSISEWRQHVPPKYL